MLPPRVAVGLKLLVELGLTIVDAVEADRDITDAELDRLEEVSDNEDARWKAALQELREHNTLEDTEADSEG